MDGIQALNTTDEHATLPDSVVSAGTIIGERYRVDRQIAEGGMATVFLAADLRHDRKVAVKVLHESLAHTIGIQRFLREIEVVARLQHPHLLTLIDSGTIDGFPFYVMPFVEAQSLRETIAERGQLPLDEAIRITREVADGLAYAHERGVVHRDIKPSNILMSDGHAIVADFGIATAIRKSSVGRITVTGSSLGSPTYMSPEQAAGEADVDQRSDVYSLACVMFEMLTGKPPIDHFSLQQMVTRKLTGDFTRLRELRPDLPVALETALHTALSPDRDSRFATVDEFSNAIAESVPTPSSFSKRARWIAAAVALVTLGGTAAVVQHQRRVVWATRQVAEISRLAHAGKMYDAFQLTQQVLPILPNDSTLNAIRPSFTDFLRIVTVPPGATVALQRFGRSDSTWTVVGATPLDSVPVPKVVNESYRLRIDLAGYESVDVFAALFTSLRYVGGSDGVDTLHLDPVGLPTTGMARIRGVRILNEAGDTVRSTDFHIGKREVTNREYAAFISAGGYAKREYWTEPMVRDGKAVGWEEGVAALRDRTGRPGPSTWSGGTFPPGEEDFPVGGVSWYEAAAYARYAGMQLPTVTHWSAAATRANRELLWMYIPTSNMNGTGVRRAGMGMMSVWGLYDVAGNVREWLVNARDGGRMTRGGSWEDSPFHISHPIAKDAFDRSPANGFRLARLADPDWIAERLARPVLRAPVRDFRAEVPVSDATFRGYRAMFDYDAKPLGTTLDEEGETSEFRWQRVSFAAAYNGPRMGAYLFFPRNASPPFEPVVLWGPTNAVGNRRLNPSQQTAEAFAGFIPRSGRVLVIPLYMGTYGRGDSTTAASRLTADTTAFYRDMMVQWIKDLRRTVDFLETRSDLKADRIGFYGVSWGGMIAPVALATEPRIKAAVLYSAGYLPSRMRPEIEPINYTPRVYTPTLLLSGRYDTVFPYETSQVPFFEHLGTREKERVLSPSSHIPPLSLTIEKSLAWFDKHLSGKVAPAQP